MPASSVSPSPRLAPRRAFTILELLVATAVFAIMAGLLFTAISQVNRAWRQADGQKNRREVGRALVDLMARDLQGAIPPLPGVGTNTVNFEFASGTSSSAASDSLYWQTALTINRSKSDLATVGYFVSDSNELCRLYTNAPVAGLSAQSGLANSTNILAEGVLRLGVTLYNKDGTIVAGSTTFTTNLPASAEIKLAIADPRTLLQHPAISVPDMDNPPAGVDVFRTRVDLPCSP